MSNAHHIGPAGPYLSQVLYGGAQRFKPDTFAKLEAMCVGYLDELASGDQQRLFAALAACTPETYARALERCRTLPQWVEDFRIDFEDGFGVRAHDAQLSEAKRVAQILATGAAASRRGSRRWGIRLPKVDESGVALAVLQTFLDTVSADQAFVVTLPKVESSDEIRSVCERVELSGHTVQLEAMWEDVAVTPDRCWLDAAGGRLESIHLGVSDLLSSMNVGSDAQSPRHSFCDAAVWTLKRTFPNAPAIVHGTTTKIPLGEASAQREAIAEHAKNILHALSLGVHRSWDLHPHQVVVRRLVRLLHIFAQEEQQAARWRAFVAGGPTRIGNDFDDAASVRPLRDFFLSADALGALTNADRQRLQLNELLSRR